LRIDEMLRLAPDLPDPLIRLAPLLQDDATHPGEEVPQDLVDLTAVPAKEPGAVEQLAERVQLELVRRPVADPNRPRAPVALEPVELDLGQQPLAADAVHDLQLARPARGRAPQPFHVRVRLVRVAENEEG